MNEQLTPRQSRAMSDARCAWKAMTPAQRVTFILHALETQPQAFDDLMLVRMTVAA